jgi:glutathione reductase (NADPH)
MNGGSGSTSMDFDLFVIGGGSGGVRAARVAAGHGARVAIAEEYRFGGTCVIRGCVPKKLLVYASRFAADFEDAAGFGWRLPKPTFDWPALVAAKDLEITRLEDIYAANLRKVDATLFAERAELTGPNQVRLASGRSLTARTILIATGGRPSLPRELPGREHAITSNEAFDLKALPRSIAIVGGGYIGLEFAGIFAGLGSQVTLVHRGDHVLRHFDADLSSRVTAAYRARGMRVELNAAFVRLERSSPSSPIAATLNTGEVVEVDQVMFATGRFPNVERLGLEAAGVRTDRNGAIVVDALSRTSSPSIYAVGDVTHRLNLTPVAVREGHAFADTVFGGNPWQVDHVHVPTAVFSTPEIGTVGLPEDEAMRQFAVLDIYRTDFRTLKSTLSGGAERMMMKLVVDGTTDRVVGAHLLGPDAGELIQVIATLLRTGVTKRDFDQTMPLHPSSAEELMTLRSRTARHIQHHASLNVVNP